MSAGLAVPKSATVESTYKARDVEGVLDIWFYRPVGYVLALGFARLRFTPSMVSLLGALSGIIAGHLYFYRDLTVNLVGITLHVFTNVLDNADGQLARLTNRGSLHGAIVDGFADYVVFLSVYVHLALRYMAEGGSAAIWLLTLGAALSHAMQSMMIDYYRNGYLQFVLGKRSADANSSATVEAAFESVTWDQLWKKIALRSYLNYTRQQEMLAPDLLKLRLATTAGAPAWFADEFRRRCLPLVKWCNGLATNARMLLLFGALLLGQPIWYLIVEVTVLNLLLLWLMLRHNRIFSSLLTRMGGAPA